MTEAEPAVYTSEDVARLLKVSRTRVYQMNAKDLIPGAIRLGPKKLVFSKSAIDHLLTRF